MTHAKFIKAFNELLDYNAYFVLKFGYSRTSGWILTIQNTNTGMLTNIYSLSAENPAQLWKQAYPLLQELKAVYVKTDGSPNWLMQEAKNSLAKVLPVEQINQRFQITERGFILDFKSSSSELSLDVRQPPESAFEAFITK